MGKITLSFCLFVVVVVLSGCQKIKTDYAKASEPSDAPKYTVEFDKNTSPVKAANPDTSR